MGHGDGHGLLESNVATYGRAEDVCRYLVRGDDLDNGLGNDFEMANFEGVIAGSWAKLGPQCQRVPVVVVCRLHVVPYKLDHARVEIEGAAVLRGRDADDTTIVLWLREVLAANMGEDILVGVKNGADGSCRSNDNEADQGEKR